MKQLRDVEAGSVVTIPMLNDGKEYIVQATEPNMPISDIDIVDEDGERYTVPCQTQVELKKQQFSQTSHWSNLAVASG